MIGKAKKNLIVADMSVNVGGGRLYVRNKIVFFTPSLPLLYNTYILTFTKMQNVLKHKNMYLEGFQVILNLFPSKTYVLDHSEFTDLHIEKLLKKI